MDDDLMFDDGPEALAPQAAPWVILVVDDEPSVHDVTRLVLGIFSFEGRTVELLHAYSGEEAAEILQRRPDTAVVLLDVVMETETAGLDLVDRVRRELNNRRVRIVLRTGQASRLSEIEMLRRYEINDYRQKTELTSQKLCSVCVLALRGYRDVVEVAA